MASLKDIRTRIASVRSTRKITSAMKMVAAAKYHRAQDKHTRFQDFMAHFERILSFALQVEQPVSHPLMTVANPEAGDLFLLFSSNTSLCGVYNANASRELLTHFSQLEDSCRATSDIWAFGRKGAELLIREGVKLAKRDEELVATPTFAQVTALFDEVLTAFSTGKYRSVQVVYNRFRNAAQQAPTILQLLPLTAPELQATLSKHEYIFEPSVQELFDYALPHYARLQLYAAVMHNAIGEHGARMTAMTLATDNADSLISELTLQYNKARQAAITNELVEIVSGAEALKNG